MSEATQQAAEFLENVFETTGLQLRVKVKQAVSGEVLDIEGQDAERLLTHPRHRCQDPRVPDVEVSNARHARAGIEPRV
jgi:hypothetical protein